MTNWSPQKITIFVGVVESMHIVNTEQTQLHAFGDARNISIITEVDTVITKDSDFIRLKHWSNVRSNNNNDNEAFPQ